MQRWICCIILFSIYKTCKGIALPASLSKCDCIQLKECLLIAQLLLNHAPHEADMIYEIVQNAGCGYSGLDPLVCCPATTDVNHKIATSSYSTEIDTGITTRGHSDIWVWRSKQLPTRLNEYPKIAEAARSTLAESCKNNSKAFYKDTNIIDFKDPFTTGNWPHSFYEEPFEYDNNDANTDQSHDYYNKHQHVAHEHHNNPSTHSQHFPHFDEFYPHNQYHDHNHGSPTDDEVYYMNKVFSIPPTSFRPLKTDGNFVYPDDERLKISLHLPIHSTQTPPTTTIRTRTKVKSTVKPTQQTTINSPLCGISQLDNVTGTRIYPWITRIAYLNKTSNVISYRCAGSVVSESHILTAAHCVTNLVKDLRIAHIRIGGMALTTNCTVKNNANCSSSTTRSYQIAQVHVHPNYDQPPYANDIAVVKIVGKVNANRHICLPPNLSNTVWNQFIGTTGIALGWTANARGGNDTAVTPTVRYLSLPIVNTTQCAITYAELNNPIVITPSQLCAQGGPMNDVCQGDSGGPLMDEGISGLINSNGRHSILGVVAFGPTNCGISNIPGVYTRVSAFLEWIIDTIRLN